MQFRTKEEQVADYLREGIIAGRFPRGARLKQQEIATLLQTSITPVREALKLLEAEGYITGDSYRGATVAPFDIDRLAARCSNLRILLETQLVRGAVERATARPTSTELRALADEFAQAFAAGDNEAARAANYRFHHRMFEIARDAADAAFRADPVGALSVRPDQPASRAGSAAPRPSTTNCSRRSSPATSPRPCWRPASTSRRAGRSCANPLAEPGADTSINRHHGRPRA